MRTRPTISITLSPEVLAALKAAASREGRTVSNWLDQWLRGQLRVKSTRQGNG